MGPAKNIFDITDEGLFKSLKKDDKNSFKEIYSRYWSKLYIFAYNILKDKDLCEDILQEVFSDLWIKRKEKDIKSVSAYLYKAVKFQIFKYFRSGRMVDKHIKEFDVFISASSTEQDAEYNEIFALVESVIAGLPEQRRIIFKLSREEGLSNKEIAEKLNISVQTVKNQISNALKTIRKSIQLWIMLFF